MSAPEIKLNIGCGLSTVSGWHNLDNSPTILLSRIPLLKKLLKTPDWPKDVRRYDVRKGLPYSENTVKFIYLSHSFHQLRRNESLQLVEECRRVLQPNGVLRIVVPDLERATREYLADSNPLAAEKFMKRVTLLHTWRDVLHPGSSVTQMFDARSLIHTLRTAGFEHAEVSSYRVSAIPEIDQLDLEVRRRESLYVEAKK